MAVEFPQAEDEMRAIFATEDFQQRLNRVEELLNQGIDLTPEQWKAFQRQTDDTIGNLLEEIKKLGEKVTRIDPSDPMEVKKTKIVLQRTYVTFVQSTFDKLKETLQWIFTQIINGTQWCWEKLKETFTAFRAVFS